MEEVEEERECKKEEELEEESNGRKDEEERNEIMFLRGIVWRREEKGRRIGGGDNGSDVGVARKKEQGKEGIRQRV